MTKIIVDDYRTLDDALHAFERQVYKDKASRWYKKRHSYYEKPSTLKRKKKKMAHIVKQQGHFYRKYHYCDKSDRSFLSLKIGIDAQFARTGKNAVGQ